MNGTRAILSDQGERLSVSKTSESVGSGGESGNIAPSLLRRVLDQIASANWRRLRSVAALLVIMIVLAIATEGTFLTPRNLTNLARQVAINGVLAVGMTYIILIGGIDLSVGSVVALAGVVAGLLQVNLGLGAWGGGVGSAALAATLLTVLAAVGVGLLCGLFNSYLITSHRIAPFIITLGLMVIARGLALILAKGAAISPLSDSFNELGQGYLSTALTSFVLGAIALYLVVRFLRLQEKGLRGFASVFSGLLAVGVGFWIFLGYRGIPIPVLIFAVLGVIGSFILSQTRLGRFVLAMGGNAEAAWLAGVPIKRIGFGIYVVMGGLAGLCGAILSARLNGALPTAGELFELDAIAAVVIGGTSLLGGVGTVSGSILGAFFIGTLNNGMSLLDVTEFYQKVIKGVIIILAVWFDMRQGKAKKVSVGQ
jgi:D-xylose transport system permease protein